MATVTGKRKRDVTKDKSVASKKVAIAFDPAVNGKSTHSFPESNLDHTSKESTSGKQEGLPTGDVTIQIITGSYERVLHGILATIPSQVLQKESKTNQNEDAAQLNDNTQDATFSDTFLFTAHTSSIRCLALSPPTEASNRILATGGSDERINLYNISTHRSKSQSRPANLPSLSSSSTTAENRHNRSLGNLIHHDRAITALHFPTKGKLFSSAEDNTIAISRTRDWTVLSSIKAPIPKPQGRPSGDTAGPGEVPAGVNDFAIHPSQKLMLSVSRGEKCMRLWNLMTGKKAGVLNFDRELLGKVGEGKYSSGEGRSVLWNESGEVFVVGFERGAVVFGIDSKPRAVVKAEPATKFHQMRFLPRVSEAEADVLAVSTEDGRILLFAVMSAETEEQDTHDLLTCSCIAQLGGRAAGIAGRIKDFEILTPIQVGEEGAMLFVTGSSDGAIRLWTVFAGELEESLKAVTHTDGEANGTAPKAISQIGKLIGTLQTGNRATCLGAIVMNGSEAGEVGGVELGAENGVLEEEEEESESEDSE